MRMLGFQCDPFRDGARGRPESTKCILVVSLTILVHNGVVLGDEQHSAVLEVPAIIEAMPNREGSTRLVFEKGSDGWSIRGLDVAIGNLTDGDLARVAQLVTLDTLRLRFGRVRSTHSLQSLAILRGLRKVGIPWTIGSGDVEMLSSLPALEELDFLEVPGTHRQFSDRDFLRFAKAGRLRRLVVPSGELGDTSLNSIVPLSSLEELDLRHNGLITSTGVSKLRVLMNLRSLKVDNLGDDDLISLSEIPGLQELGTSNYIWSKGLGDLSMLRRLTSLKLYAAKCRGRGLIEIPICVRNLELLEETAASLEFRSCHNLQSMTIDLGNPRRREGRRIDLQWLRKVPNVRSIVLVNPIESDVEAIALLSQLESIGIECDCETGITDKGIQALKKLVRLESISIRVDSGITDSGMAALRHLGHIRQLKLAGIPGVTRNTLNVILGLRTLHVLELNLYGNVFDVSASSKLQGVGRLRELEDLALIGASLSDDDLAHLAVLRKLKRLDLTGSHGFSASALASLLRMLPELREVITSCTDMHSGKKREQNGY
jgi:hypothetical protein